MRAARVPRVANEDEHSFVFWLWFLSPPDYVFYAYGRERASKPVSEMYTLMFICGTYLMVLESIH